MRFHLKKALQVLLVCGCVFLYINFFLTTKSGLGDEDPEVKVQVSDATGQGREVKVKRSAGHGGLGGIPVDGVRLFTEDTKMKNVSLNLTRVEKEKVTKIHLETKELKSAVYNGSIVYPDEEHYKYDRITEQLAFVPESVKKAQAEGREVPLKKIYVASGVGSWVKRGQATFLEQSCKVPYCDVTDSRSDRDTADIVLTQGSGGGGEVRPPHQIWLLYLLESPYHTPNLGSSLSSFNWTATYRHDSTIVAPYEKFVPFNTSILTKPQNRNYAEGKTKKVAWFVSNCGARNGRRQYADELAKHIDVDIYGQCGTLKCPRHKSSECFDMLNKDYKFYLSFENSNCRDYITEKFFVNGLKHDVLPIVMGAAPEDYTRASPPNSFIHVDQFESPKDLAEYLHKLDKDDALYNEYFQWKGTGDNINTLFWCRVCAMAHDVDTRGASWYQDVNSWWRGGEMCIGPKTWREHPPKNKLIADLPIVTPPHDPSLR